MMEGVSVVINARGEESLKETFEELSLISGTGSSNRVTKTDILNYISKNKDFKRSRLLFYSIPKRLRSIP